MRLLVILTLVLAAAWGGYWALGAKTTERQIRGWIDARGAEGWVANYSDITTSGFPNRFDTTISDPELADPASGLAWRADFLQFLSLSYKPHHLIAVWPEIQTLATPNQTVTIRAEDMRGSLQVDPTRNLALNSAVIEAQSVALISTADWQMHGDQGLLALRETPAQPLTYDIALRLENVTPPARLTRLAESAGISPGDLGRAELDATIAFDAAWDLAALERARPQPQSIDLREARVKWGALNLQIGGELTMDGRGRPSGELTIRASNWRGMLDLAAQSGMMSREMADLLENGLNLVSRFSGNGNAIDVPLTFRNGAMSLGGLVPLGSAPPLILR